MHSFLLLAYVGCLLAVPGSAASLAVLLPGEASVVTRSAAAFGLGYAVCAGGALILAVAHAFKLIFFLFFWFAASAALWLLALRRASLRDHARAIREDIYGNRLILTLGTLALGTFLVLHFKFLHLLGASRYVYYLNGIEITNAHGIPSSTLEFGQSWPPATDKIVLDAFTGVLVLLGHSITTGPGVLLWLSILGSALGLWATGWELGLRHTSVLLPLLVINNQVIFHRASAGQAAARVSTNFAEYRAEDFGRAVAFCALALSIYAIRRRRWSLVIPAGIVLAAASGTHLVPAVVVVLTLCFVGVAELLRGNSNRDRLLTLRRIAALGGVSAAFALLVRIIAGGTFGLGGASSPSDYAALHMRFDPTAYLYSGAFTPLRAQDGHWYVPPHEVVNDIMSGSGIHWPAWAVWLFLIAVLLAAILLFLLVKTDLRTIGVVGAGLLAGLIGIALFFSYRYQIFVEGTFGVRRLRDFSTFALMLVGLGVAEMVLIHLRRNQPTLSLSLAVILIVTVSAWVLPSSTSAQQLSQVSRERIEIMDWLRIHTPCNARLLDNERSEGAFTALTGRFALLEGMGPFLRVDRLPSTVRLFLSARQFLRAPRAHQEFLRDHDISYVVLEHRHQLLGYEGPTGRTNFHNMGAASFLHRVFANRSVIVYRVTRTRMLPASPLLTGPYLHCIRAPVVF